MNRIGGIMVRLCAWSVVDRGVAGVDPAGRTRRAPPPLKLEKIWFFYVKSWFFTRNTPNFSRLPPLGAIFLSRPPPNLKSWIRPWVEPDRVKPKTIKLVVYFSAKHAALRRKSKAWLARNQGNVSEWDDMFIHGLLFHWASTIIRFKASAHHHFILRLTLHKNRKIQ